jgi:type I restriction enzyme S subunit
VLIRPNADLDRGFLAYFLSSPIGQSLFASITTGTAQRKFNKTTLRRLEVPVPACDEQRRIVAEIEKQFTRLEAGVAALRRVAATCHSTPGALAVISARFSTPR